MISVDKETVFRWESNESLPSVLLLPAIIRFLGHDPLPTPKTFSEQLRHSRRYLGLSQTATARLLGIDPTTLRKWEQGRLEPKTQRFCQLPENLKRLDQTDEIHRSRRGSIDALPLYGQGNFRTNPLSNLFDVHGVRKKTHRVVGRSKPDDLEHARVDRNMRTSLAILFTDVNHLLVQFLSPNFKNDGTMRRRLNCLPIKIQICFSNSILEHAQSSESENIVFSTNVTGQTSYNHDCRKLSIDERQAALSRKPW